MKNSPYYFLLFFIVVVMQTFASDSSTNDWGAVTNNLQMSVMLGDNKAEIRAGQSLGLIVRIKNVSTNETFHLIEIGQLIDDMNYSFTIVFPSGKSVSPERPKAQIGSDVGSNIGSSEIYEREFDLNKLCRLDEIGTYKITVQRMMQGAVGTEEVRGNVVTVKTFTVTSNPIYVHIVR